MHLLKRIGISILTTSTILVGIAGCGSSSTGKVANKETVSTEASVTKKEEAKETNTTTGKVGRTIVDQAGNEVVLPEKIERVVISSLWPLPSVYCLFQGSAEGLVGMHPASKAAAENSMLTKVVDISGIETNFMQGGQINVEELLKLNPDVVFYSSVNTEEYEILKKAGIPAVGFTANPTGDGNSIEAVASWMEQLGIIFNKENRVEEIKEAGYEVLDRVQEKVGTIKDKERVLIIFHYSDTELTVAGKGHFGDYWIEAAGGINVAGELKGTPSVNMEQIYAWNPDKIFITNFTNRMPEDLIDNVINGTDWSSVKAVQDKEVYKVPLGMYRWYPPSSDSPLMLQWFAKQLYPELFEDVDMNKEVKAYFKKFYDVELTEEDLHSIFNPSREAANGV